MELLPDCYSCAMRQAASAANLVSDDDSFLDLCAKEVSAILKGASPAMTPPALAEIIYSKIGELSGNNDPFRDKKSKQNQAAFDLLPWLRKTINSAPDPLLMAVRIAIAGNVVDPAAHESFDLEGTVMEAVEFGHNLEAYPVFKRKLAEADSILLIADNCGEIVFDRVLLETISGSSGARMVAAVRDAPIINDVTMREAIEVGLPDICEVISSGSRMPGTFLPGTSPEFQKLFHESDLVISKGQGNWETLENSDREIFFMLQVKCMTVSMMTGLEVGQPVLAFHDPA